MALVVYVNLCEEFGYNVESSLSAEEKHEKFGSLSSAPAPAPTEEYGFIITRCVKAEAHSYLWKECYSYIRQHFPMAPILIIDDHSNQTLIDQAFTESMTKTVVIASELHPGAGEILPYYYYYKQDKIKPAFRKAVILNDGMFIIEKEPMASAINATVDYRFLWYFDGGIVYYERSWQDMLIQGLKPEVKDHVIALHNQMELWAGCFASAMIITRDFLDLMESKYGLFGTIPMINTRLDRQALERILGMLSIDLTELRPPEQMSVWGHLSHHKKSSRYSYADFLADREAGTIGQAGIKIWNGRRR